MKILRLEKSADAIIGILLHDGKLICNTLEHPALFIPADTYPCVFEYSDKFKRKLWEIKGVPARSECKFHTGNTKADTTGCIIVGKALGVLGNVRAVLMSRMALEEIENILNPAITYHLSIIEMLND